MHADDDRTVLLVSKLSRLWTMHDTFHLGLLAFCYCQIVMLS
jgi:hypothetical protein